VTVAIDAGLLAALLLPLPYSELAQVKMSSWLAADEILVAPILLSYEVTSIFRKAVAQGWLTTAEAADAVEKLLSTDIHWVAPSAVLNRRALEWSERLGQRVAYDSSYLAVAESERVDLWTTDRKLANGARRLGVDWVRHLWESKEAST